MRLAFEGLSRPVALIDCGELVVPIASVLRGWRVDEIASDPAPPVITVEATKKGYRIESPWLDAPLVYRDSVDAVCAFLVDLIRAFIADDPTLLCLHCAAAEFAGRLVIFPSEYRAGKSTLSAYLAAAGVRLYADDVLPIKEDGNWGVAPGILPRLRLPLPDGAGAAFGDFVRGHAGLGNKRYQYLELDASVLPPLGTAAPIGGFVLLHRDEAAPATLAPIGKSEMLRRVILRNFAHGVQAVDILGRLHALVDEGQCYALHYANGEEAVALLEDTFASWPSPPPVRSPDTAGDTGVAEIGGGSDGPTYRRSAGVTETVVEHDLFLANRAEQGIYQLNAVGAALWRLLADSIAVAHAVDVLHQAFPDVARGQIERDVTTLLDELASRGLVTRTP